MMGSNSKADQNQLFFRARVNDRKLGMGKSYMLRIIRTAVAIGHPRLLRFPATRVAQLHLLR